MSYKFNNITDLENKIINSNTLFKNLENSKQESVKQQKIIEFFDNLAD